MAEDDDLTWHGEERRSPGQETCPAHVSMAEDIATLRAEQGSIKNLMEEVRDELQKNREAKHVDFDEFMSVKRTVISLKHWQLKILATFGVVMFIIFLRSSHIIEINLDHTFLDPDTGHVVTPSPSALQNLVLVWPMLLQWRR